MRTTPIALVVLMLLVVGCINPASQGKKTPLGKGIPRGGEEKVTLPPVPPDTQDIQLEKDLLEIGAGTSDLEKTIAELDEPEEVNTLVGEDFDEIEGLEEMESEFEELESMLDDFEFEDLDLEFDF